MNSERDRPAQDGEIEVTPEMIEAAVNVIFESGLLNDSTVSMEVVVEAIIREAAKVRQ